MSTKRKKTGRSSEYADVGVNIPFASPGALTTTDNALFVPAMLPIPVKIIRLRVAVRTAPTGAAITVDFKFVTLSTGVVGATIGTVTVAINAFYGELVLSTPTAWAVTDGVVPEITQVGSVVPGSNANLLVESE